MRAVIYARVSTTMQEDNESLKFQIQKCKDFCKIKGYKITKILQDVESGGKDRRAGFLELKNNVENSTFDILVVYESSRVSRKTLTMIKFVNSMQEKDIRFVSISQPELDTTTPTGMLFFNIQASLGDYERKLISGRVKSGKWARAKVGRWQGGILPIGYKKNEDGKTIIIDENSSVEVRAMFDFYLAVQSIQKTAQMFNRHPESMRWILTNKFYTGLMKYGKKEKNINTGQIKVNNDYQYFEGQHPAIIDTETFENVQSLIFTNKKIRTPEYRLLFSGIVECECGGKMHSHKRDKWYNYECNECKKNISEKKLEKAVIQQLFLMQELEDLNNNDTAIEKYKKELSNTNKQLKSLATERKKYISLYAKGMLSEKDLESFIDGIDGKINYFTKEIKNLENIIENNKLIEEKENNLKVLQNVLANMEDSDREDLYKLFKLLIERITILNRAPLAFKIYLK